MNEIKFYDLVYDFASFFCVFTLLCLTGMFLQYIYDRMREHHSKHDNKNQKANPILDPEGKRYKEIKSLLDELDALDLAIENERDMDTLFILWKHRTEAGIKIEILIN